MVFAKIILGDSRRMMELSFVLNRVYENCVGEIRTLYGQLQKILNVKLEPAPDAWDRAYNVDFYIPVNDKYVGLQIKSISSGITSNQYAWGKMHKDVHKKFTNKFGGKVFLVYFVNVNNKKQIYNPEVIPEIEAEIKRLRE